MGGTSRILRARLDVPPDQAAVVAARDQRRAGKGEAGHVAVVPAELLRLGLGLVEVELVDREVRAAAEDAGRVGLCRGRRCKRRKDDIGAGELFDRLEFFGYRWRHGRDLESGENLADRFSAGVGEGNGAGADHVFFLMVDAQCLVDRGEELGWPDLAVGRRPGRSCRSCRRPSRRGRRRPREWRSRRRRSGRGPG